MVVNYRYRMMFLINKKKCWMYIIYNCYDIFYDLFELLNIYCSSQLSIKISFLFGELELYICLFYCMQYYYMFLDVYQFFVDF